MSSPLPPDRQEFDLSAEAAYVRRREASTRVFVAAIGAAMGLLGVYVVIPPYHQPAPVVWGLGVFLWGVGATMVVLVLRLGRTPPMTRLAITPTSLQVEYADGSRSSLDWRDPGFGLALFDYSQDPGAIGSERKHVWISLPNRRGGTVPEGVLEALIAAAHQHDLPVLVREELIPAGKGVARPEVTRIGRPEETPGWSKAIPVKR